MIDAYLIPIEEWCIAERECEQPASQILIASNGEIVWYCDACGEDALQRERDKGAIDD